MLILEFVEVQSDPVRTVSEAVLNKFRSRRRIEVVVVLAIDRKVGRARPALCDFDKSQNLTKRAALIADSPGQVRGWLLTDSQVRSTASRGLQHARLSINQRQ